MSRVATPTGETVDPGKRRVLTPTQKRMIWDDQAERCVMCDFPVTLAATEFDHFDAHWISGRNDLKNFRGLCVPCHKIKTKADKGVIAHIKRIIKKNTEPREPSKIRSRGFAKPTVKTVWPSRPFPKRNP